MEIFSNLHSDLKLLIVDKYLKEREKYIFEKFTNYMLNLAPYSTKNTYDQSFFININYFIDCLYDLFEIMSIYDFDSQYAENFENMKHFLREIIDILLDNKYKYNKQKKINKCLTKINNNKNSIKTNSKDLNYHFDNIVHGISIQLKF